MDYDTVLLLLAYSYSTDYSVATQAHPDDCGCAPMSFLKGYTVADM